MFLAKDLENWIECLIFILDGLSSGIQLSTQSLDRGEKIVKHSI